MAADNRELFKTPAAYQRAMHLYDAQLARITVPYETVQVLTQYGQTTVIAAGPPSASPVVMWHGYGLMGPTWSLQINVLARSYRVFAPDVIGSMGRSAPTQPNFKGPEYGFWMVDVLNGLGLDEAHHIGISNGCWLIVKLATVASEQIISAVLMSAAGFALPDWRVALRLLPGLGPNPFWSKERRVRYFLRVMAPPGQEITEEVLQLMLTFLHYHRHKLPPQWLTDSELRRLTVPTYLMMAEYERSFSPKAVIRRAQDTLPNLVKTEMIPGVGHGMENAEQINQRLLAWLDSF